MDNRNFFPGLRRVPAACVWSLVTVFSACVPVTSAGAAVSDAPAANHFSPEVTKYLEQADAAEREGKFDLALIHINNAVRWAPLNGELRARLGAALLKNGDTTAAERELRQALTDNARDDLVVPKLLDAMIARGESRQLLTEFADPPAGTDDPLAPDVLRARALALENLGRRVEANATMERSLAIRRDARSLTSRAKLVADQNDLALANRLLDEAIKLEPRDEDALAAKVAVLFQGGELKQALAAADEFVSRLPLSRIAKVFRIEVLLGLNEDARARAELGALLKLSPHSAFGPYYDGVFLARAGDIKGAWTKEQLLQNEFVLAQPNIATRVADIAIANGNLEIGAGILSALVERSPTLSDARIRLASVQLTLGAPANAIKTLEPVKNIDDPRVPALLGQADLQLGRSSDATAAFEKSMGATGAGNNGILKQQLAESAFQLGDSETAIRTLKEILARNHGNWNNAVPLISILAQSGRTGEALDVVNRTAEDASRSPLGPFYRGRVLAAAGNLTGASTAFSEALAIDAKFEPALYFRAHVATARGDVETGTKDLQKIIAQNPANVSAYIALAEIALHQGQEPQAIDLLTRAMKAAPREPGPRLALASLQSYRRDFNEAEATLRPLLLMSPANPQALTELGQIQFKSGAAGKAVETFRGLAAAYPNSSGTYVLLARLLSATRDHTGAIDAARRAVELSPFSVRIRSLLIEYLVAGGKPDEALANAQEFASAHPSPDADLLVASTLDRLDRKRDSYSFLGSRFAAKPDRLLAMQLSESAMNLGDSGRAVSVLQEWLGKHDADYDIRRQYGSLLLQTGKTAEARKEFEALLKQRPEDPLVLNNLAWCLRDEDPSRAYDLVSLAAKIVPDSTDIMDTLAWMKFHRRDLQGALSLLRRAHQLDAEDGEIAYHYAVALDATGSRAEAKTLLQTIIAKNSGFNDRESARKLLATW